MKLLLSCLVVCCGVAACGGKGGEAAGGGKEPAAAAPSAGPKELKLSNGLTVTAPGDAKETDMGGIAVSALNGKCMAMINEKSDMSPSFENELQNIEKGNKGGALKEMKRKDQKGPDDFAIEWTTDKKFGYSSRRTIGGKAYSCFRVSADPDGHACVVAICESMK
jgi:hypothetical protein